MKRVIKFRAWDSDFGSMVYEFTEDGYSVDMQNGNLVAGSIDGNGDYFEMELMQFTGLTDKSGKEIYVGDILSALWKVEVFQNDEGTFMVKFHTNPSGNRPLSLKKYLKYREQAGTREEDNTIIGNIYENPELIQTK